MRSRWLYLDFDGVLHPDEVYLTKKGVPELRGEGSLFMWEPALIAALAAYPDVQIILSTSWVHHLGLDRTSAYLSDALRRRVIGTSQRGRARAREVESHIDAHAPDDWIIVDDYPDDWSYETRGRLVLCDPIEGLGDPPTLELLRELLAKGASRG